MENLIDSKDFLGKPRLLEEIGIIFTNLFGTVQKKPSVLHMSGTPKVYVMPHIFQRAECWHLCLRWFRKQCGEGSRIGYG